MMSHVESDAKPKRNKNPTAAALKYSLSLLYAMYSNSNADAGEYEL